LPGDLAGFFREPKLDIASRHPKFPARSLAEIRNDGTGTYASGGMSELKPDIVDAQPI
jgi:hypothetical protein